MKTILFFFLFAMFALTSCNYNNHVQIVNQSNDRKLPDTKYLYLDRKQISTPFVPDEKIEPIEGEMNWKKRFYTILDYPSSARNSGIQGICILSVKLNEFGTVLDFDVTKSPSPDFDSAIKLAFSKTMPQYTPPKYNGISIKCIMEIPIGFWLPS